MKTLFISFAAVILFSTAPVNAQAMCVSEGAAGAPQATIFSKIQQNMHVPAGMKSEISSERVRVVFTIDETGKAHVLDVATRRPDLKPSVIQQFEAIDFSGTENHAGQEYSIWLNFNVL